jgi:hypothetical protein
MKTSTYINQYVEDYVWFGLSLKYLLRLTLAILKYTYFSSKNYLVIYFTYYVKIYIHTYSVYQTNTETDISYKVKLLNWNIILLRIFILIFSYFFYLNLLPSTFLKARFLIWLQWNTNRKIFFKAIHGSEVLSVWSEIKSPADLIFKAKN